MAWHAWQVGGGAEGAGAGLGRPPSPLGLEGGRERQ